MVFGAQVLGTTCKCGIRRPVTMRFRRPRNIGFTSKITVLVDSVSAPSPVWVSCRQGLHTSLGVRRGTHLQSGPFTCLVRRHLAVEAQHQIKADRPSTIPDTAGTDLSGARGRNQQIEVDGSSGATTLGSRIATSALSEPTGLGVVETDKIPKDTSFCLPKQFIEAHGRHQQPPFGFNGLGALVYQRTYARYLRDDSDEREAWYQTIERVVNGTFSMQKEWMMSRGLPWHEEEAQETAQEMYRRMFDMKFLPPGRGLWAMGSKLTTERRLYAALNNCAFVSTKDLAKDPVAPFCFLMDASMLGVGVGFDTKGAGTIRILPPGSAEVLTMEDPEERQREIEMKVVVEDSREGWRDALEVLLEAYFYGHKQPVFDMSLLRPPGAPIRGFGGVSQGSAPLRELMAGVKATLDALVGKPLSVTAIVDIMNKIGVCVVAGNVRRTAEIAFGDAESEEYIDLKNYDKNPERAGFGWASNNSIMAKLGMDYVEVCKRVSSNGEPGFAWLDNMRGYGRMADPRNDQDARAMGGNPCLEQTLESFEMCCLVETFPHKHDSLDDFLRTLRLAFLYAKTVTLGATHWPETNEILFRNRRIGCSMSGLAQFVSARGLGTLRNWCEEGYQTVLSADKEFSSALGVPVSIKTTSIKPSGTVSLLAGATPGMHYPEARFYLRRVRISKDSDVLGPLRDAGYKIEPAVSDPSGTVVVEIPVDAGAGVRTARDLTMWEQLSFAAFLQRYWADNQVSCTITFDPKTEGQDLARALDYFQYQLKGVSFLPRMEHGAFPQMPYEAISEEEYVRLTANLGTLDFSQREGPSRRSREKGMAQVEVVPDNFCRRSGEVSFLNGTYVVSCSVVQLDGRSRSPTLLSVAAMLATWGNKVDVNPSARGF